MWTNLITFKLFSYILYTSNFSLIKWIWKNTKSTLQCPEFYTIFFYRNLFRLLLLLRAGIRKKIFFSFLCLSEEANILLVQAAILSLIICLQGMVSSLHLPNHLQSKGYTILSLPALLNFGINHWNNCCHHYMLLIKPSNCFSTQIQSCWLSCSKWIFHSIPVIILITTVQWLLNCAYRSGP